MGEIEGRTLSEVERVGGDVAGERAEDGPHICTSARRGGSTCSPPPAQGERGAERTASLR